MYICVGFGGVSDTNGSNSARFIYTIGRLSLRDIRATTSCHSSFSTSTMNSYIPSKHEQLLSVQAPVLLSALLPETGAKQHVEEIVVSKHRWGRVPGDLTRTGNPKDQGSRMSPEGALAIPRERHSLYRYSPVRGDFFRSFYIPW
jgi:hypothetical protein